jgi:lipoprotein-releasing system ATP-binding protein
MLTTHHLTKSYGLQKVLSNVNFSIKQGETAAIVGPSGTGKTTFLNILGTLDVPDSGQILFNQKDIGLLNEEERTHFRNRHIGFVFQMHYLLPQCSVLENVLLPTITLKDKAEKTRLVNRANELLDLVGMTAHRNKLPGQLSGGECQRTAFARALIHHPELVLADEPTGSLDEDSAAILTNELLLLNKELNTTLIVVTHSMALAQQLDSKWQLHQHQLVKTL